MDKSPLLNDTQTFSRRAFVRTGMMGTAALGMMGAVGTLTGCSGNVPLQKGYRVLREADIVMLTAMAPVLMKGVIVGADDIERAVRGMDRFLANSHPMIIKQTLPLFDALNLTLTRGLITGLWTSWEKASEAQIDDALKALRDHAVGLLQMAYGAVSQIANMSWYMQPDTFAFCGYPGPPKKIPFHAADNATSREVQS